MRLEQVLKDKAGCYAYRMYGICDYIREQKKVDWPRFIAMCTEDNCAKFAECEIHKSFSSFYNGSVFMMNRLKHLVMEKVVIDLIEEESPYNDGPVTFDVEL